LMNGLRKDEIGKVVEKDHLILQLGQGLCNKFGGECDQLNYIRFKMWQAAKVLLALCKSSGQTLTMSDCIDPKRFADVVSTTQQCAGQDEDGGQYKTLSAALKCGGLLKRLAELKQCGALQRGDTATAEMCTHFMTCCTKQWPENVSAVALCNISDRKRSGVLFMPLTEDVMKLNQYLVSEANRLTGKDPSTVDDFLASTQLVLAKVILFN
jgi:hypothetical protein